jgi:HrpA-like RNA helicase
MTVSHSQPKELVYEYASGNGSVRYSMQQANSFLKHLLTSNKLTIESHLKEFEYPKRFFLVAGTGLGKTVALPVFLWAREMRDRIRFLPFVTGGGYVPSEHSPRIWVVEPTIIIAQDLESKLNSDWNTYWNSSSPATLFGCRTKYDRRNPNAPIMFVTYGIFSIYARKGVFRAGHDVVLIDEAHDTLERDEAVELGVAMCNADKVSINFMSATVDTTEIPTKLDARVVSIPGKRQPVWKHNTKRSLEECIVELVEKTLVRQDLSSEFFPKPIGNVEKAVRASVAESGRAKGMLVIVNSFTNERSDARRIKQLLKNPLFASEIEVGLLASEIRRDAKRRTAFEKTLKRWIDSRARYVLISTNVVEKGVTLPDLDFIVTMDSGYEDSDFGAPKKIALGTNALIQRIGRVGRTRPGIAYITREIGAPYSNLDDTTLNSESALKPQPIRFPFENGSSTWLAYLAFERNDYTEARRNATKSLRVPSFINATSKKVAEVKEEAEKLRTLGIVGKDDRLTALGRLMQNWIGRMDLESAMAAHRAFDGNNSQGLVQAICQGALKATSEEPPWNMEAVKNTKLHQSPPPVILHVILDNFARWLALTKWPSWIGRAWFAAEAELRFQRLEIQEDHFFHLLRHIKELMDNFVDVVGGLHAIDKNIFRGFLRIRQVVEELPHLRS